MIILWQAEEEEGECVGHHITSVPTWNLALVAVEGPYTPLILVGKELKLGQFRQRKKVSKTMEFNASQLKV